MYNIFNIVKIILKVGNPRHKGYEGSYTYVSLTQVDLRSAALVFDELREYLWKMSMGNKGFLFYQQRERNVIEHRGLQF